jgi:hypothetical protein
MERAPAPVAVLPALLRLLRPLVRLAIRCGVTYPVLADHLRALFVEVAQQEPPDQPSGWTDSRLSLRTGVHRKEIRRLRLEPLPPDDAPPAVVTSSSRIIAAWLGAPSWTNADGTPMALPRVAPPGAPSFESLVASLTTDIRPRAVLDEWISHGIVSIDNQDRVVLDATAFVPAPGDAAQLFYFGRNLHDHAAAAAANVLTSGAAPFLERSLHYDRLPPDIAARLAALGREEGQDLLIRLNRAALDWLGADEAPAIDPSATMAPTQRVNFGLYLYVEDEPTGVPK